MPFKDEADAIALANDSPYGLAAAVWTKDVMKAHRVADRLDVGIVWINDHHRNDPSSPWYVIKFNHDMFRNLSHVIFNRIVSIGEV